MSKSQERSGHVRDADIPWTVVPGDTKRKYLVYEPKMLLMRNVFETGFAGKLHSHPHVQASYIVSGKFEITIDGRTEAMGPGDAFLIPSGLDHAAKCIEAGEIIEVFTPTREDFFGN